MKKKFFLLFILIAHISNAQTNHVLDFDGSGDYVNLGTSVVNNVRTVEFWYKPAINVNSSITASGHTMLVRQDMSQYNEFGFAIYGTEWPLSLRGRMFFFMRDNGVLHEITSDSDTWDADTWYHIAGTIDPVSGMKFYVNGVLQSDTDPTGIYPIPASSEETMIGTWGNALIRHCNGQIEELSFWNVALTQPELHSDPCDFIVPGDEPALIGYWHMDEGSGLIIQDATSFNHDGSIVNANYELNSNCSLLPPAPVDDSNYVLEFDGINDYVDLGNDAATSTRSIEFWFKPDHTLTPSLTEDGVSLIVRNGLSLDDEFGFAIYGTEWPAIERGYLYFFIRDNGVLHQIESNTNIWNGDTWYHVCGTASAAAGMKLYINGVLQTDTEPTGTIAIPASTDEINLGRWGDAGIRYFEGEMDELRFWDVALTQPEIELNMCDSVIPADEPALIGYWKMDEGTGLVLLDETDYENDGDIVGAIYLQDTICSPNDLGILTDNQISVSVYPNPFSEYTTFSVNQPLSNATLTIYNAFGQQVKQVTAISAQIITLDGDGLASGFYFFELKEDNQIISTGKLIVTQNL